MFIKRIVCLGVSVFAASCSLAAENRPTDANREGTVSRLRVDQRTIRTLVRQLASNCETEWLEAKHKLLAAGRLSVDVLWKAVETDEQPLAERARAVLSALSRSHIQLKDALDRPVEHVLVEFFELVPYSRQLKDQSFAHGFTDVWGGLHLPPSPSKQVGITLQARLTEHGATTVTRLSANDLRQIHSERRPRQFRYLWLPVLPPGSEHKDRAVSGVVQDESGRPIAGAEVHAASVFSPTEVYFKGIDPQSSVLTDRNGQFRFYLPHRFYRKHNARYPWSVTPRFRIGPVISSDILPADSEYNLTVRVPGDLTLCPAQLSHDLSSAAVIRLARTDRIRRFEFESLAGALITDESELAKIVLRYRPPDAQRPLWQAADEWLDVDQRIVMGGGPTHAGYYWASYEDSSGETVSWEIQRIDDTSPDVIRLRSPPPVVFRGRVLDGTTGKPLAGVFVASIRSRMAEQSLADVTSDEWDAVERLPEKPSLDAAALEPIQRTYTLRSLVRTDSDGRYELVQQPDDRFSSVRAIARNKLETSVDVHKGEHFSDVPDLLLFPAAKIRLRASQIHSQISVHWSLPPGDQPKWLSTLQDYVRNSSLHHGVYSDRSVAGGRTLRPKSPIWMSVPAGLRFRLEGESGRDRWQRPRLAGAAPKIRIVDGTVYHLEEGAAVDLGELPLKPPLVVRVQVVGPKMQPVARVDVGFVYSRRLEPSWSTRVPTNEQGIAELHVSQDTRKLRLGASGGGLFSTNYFTEEIEIEWAGPLPEEPIRIELSEEQVRILAEQQGD